MGLFGSGGLFGSKAAPVVPDATGKLPANVIHPKVVAAGIAGLIPVGVAIAALLTGNLHGTFATILGFSLPFILSVAAAYLAKSPPTPLMADVGQVIQGMQEGLNKPPA